MLAKSRAGVDHGQDEYEVVLVEVHNPVALEDQFPDIFSGFSFWRFSSQFREIFQCFSRLKDTFYELPGIIRGNLWRYRPESLSNPPAPVPSI
jgi:hypothetical protein